MKEEKESSVILSLCTIVSPWQRRNELFDIKQLLCLKVINKTRP